MSKILQTPIINTITPFDPLYDNVINFTYYDNQSVRNRAIITNNHTNEIVYDRTQDTMKLQHTIPASTLLAGNQYLIQIQVFDEDGNFSNLTDYTLFYCFSTPQFNFNGIQSGDIYKNASIALDLIYEQSENESIKSFQFMKYSYDKTLLSVSDMFYYGAPMSYSFYSLENKTTYYFRAIGETSHGIQLDTGYIEINISYEQIPMNVLFDLENNYDNGYISLMLNIKDVDHKTEDDDYTFEDGMIVLTGNSLTYEGFSAPNNFALYFDVKKIKNGMFLTTNNNIFSLSAINVCGSYYCELSVGNSDFRQYVALPKAQLETASLINVSPLDNDTVIFEVKRHNGYYSLNAYNRSEL